jgi:SET domain-containing protein
MHLLRERKLRIKESTIPGVGKGLFALDKRAAGNAILFRRGDKIIMYDGEVVTQAQLQRRYGDFTAPYGISQGKFVEDSACRRGAGSLVNHAAARNTNARLAFSTRTKKFMLIATKNIRNGDEIFCSYGKAYQHNDGLTHKTSQRARTYRV